MEQPGTEKYQQYRLEWGIKPVVAATDSYSTLPVLACHSLQDLMIARAHGMYQFLKGCTTVGMTDAQAIWPRPSRAASLIMMILFENGTLQLRR